MYSGVFHTLSDIRFTLKDIPEREEPKRVMMCMPTYYDLEQVKPDSEGDRIDSVDKHLANCQWEELRAHYSRIGLEIVIVPAQPEHRGMVFTANHGVSLMRQGKKEVIISRMKTTNRQEETKFFDVWYRLQKYVVRHLSANVSKFAGMDDVLWQPGKMLMWGGLGNFTELEAYKEISRIWNIPILTLQLVDSRFYHLSSCLCPLNYTTAIVYPPAFSDEGFVIVKRFFSTVIEAPEHEAIKLLACHAHSPDGKTVLIQRGCYSVNEKLLENGFTVVELETSEFLKSGKSVFSMKMMVY